MEFDFLVLPRPLLTFALKHLAFGVSETTVKKLSSKPCFLFATILAFSVMCNVTLKCYLTAERSPGNNAEWTCDILGNLLSHYFSRKKILQFFTLLFTFLPREWIR